MAVDKKSNPVTQDPAVARDGGRPVPRDDADRRPAKTSISGEIQDFLKKTRTLATPVEGRWLAIEGARPADGKLDLPEGVASALVAEGE